MDGKTIPELFAIYRANALVAGSEQDSPERRRARAEIQEVADELYERFGKQCLNTLRTMIVRKGGRLAGIRVGQSSGGQVDSQALNSIFNQAWADFLKRLLAQEELKLDGSAVAYLITVVKNAHLERERRRKRGIARRTVIDTSTVERVPSPSIAAQEQPARDAEAEQLRTWLAQEADPKMRRILELRLTAQPPTYEAIGAELGMNADAVRKKLFRWIARKKGTQEGNDNG